MLRLFLKTAKNKRWKNTRKKKKKVKSRPLIVVARNVCTEFILICLDKVAGNKDPYNIEKASRKMFVLKQNKMFR